MCVGRSLLEDVLTVGAAYPLFLTGGCALHAHGVADCRRDGATVATDHPSRLEWIASQVHLGLRELGWDAEIEENGALAARIGISGKLEMDSDLDTGVTLNGDAARGAGMALEIGSGLPMFTGVDITQSTDTGPRSLVGGGERGDEGHGPYPGTGVIVAPGIGASPTPRRRHTIRLLKELPHRPPAPTPLGLALSLPDAVGVKVRDLAGRGLPRDLVRVHAVADRWSWPELEELGRRHSRDGLELADLRARLERAEWMMDDADLTGCADVRRLRKWAQEWADDIGERLLEGGPPDELP